MAIGEAGYIEREKYLYLARDEPYDADQPFELLVQLVEALFKSETTAWARAMRAARVADNAEHERATDVTG